MDGYVLWSMRVLGSPLHQGLRFFGIPRQNGWPDPKATHFGPSAEVVFCFAGTAYRIDNCQSSSSRIEIVSQLDSYLDGWLMDEKK